MTTDERIKTIRDALLPLDDAWDALNSLVAELDAARARAQRMREELAEIGAALNDPADNLTATTAQCITRLRAREAKLREAAQYYMSQFGQALEANDIPYGSDQSEADSALRAALAEGEDTHD